MEEVCFGDHTIQRQAICVYHNRHLRQVAQTSAKFSPRQSNTGETKSIEATAPELGTIYFWSSKSSTFSGSGSNVGEGTHQVNGRETRWSEAICSTRIIK